MNTLKIYMLNLTHGLFEAIFIIRLHVRSTLTNFTFSSGNRSIMSGLENKDLKSIHLLKKKQTKNKVNQLF